MLIIRLSFRPKHGIYENIISLFINPVLPLLVIALADKAFQDYNIFKKIEDIPPPENEFLYHLHIKNEMLNLPFLQNITLNEPIEKIQGVVSLSNRTITLNHRTGY